MNQRWGDRLARFILFVVTFVTPATLRGQVTQPGDVRQHLARGQEALKANQLDQAEKEYREALRLNPLSAEAHANLGLIAFARTRFAEAAAAFRAALKLRPALRTAQAYLGLSEARLGNTRAAVPLLTVSFPQLRDTGLKTRTGLELMRIQFEAKQYGRGLDVLRVLQGTSPNDPEVLYAAYRTYSDLASQALGTLVQLVPQSARVQQVLAQALESQDDVAGAIAQYRRVLEIDSQSLGIHSEIGRLLLVMSQQEPARQQAQKEFEAELTLNPRDANSEYELGGIYWLRSDMEQAARHYARALDFRPEFVDAHIALGRVRMAQGELERALTHFLQAVRLDPQNETAHYRAAQAYRKLGGTQEADRERATFQQLRDSQAPLRALYEQLQSRTTTGQRIEAPNTMP